MLLLLQASSDGDLFLKITKQNTKLKYYYSRHVSGIIFSSTVPAYVSLFNAGEFICAKIFEIIHPNSTQHNSAQQQRWTIHSLNCINKMKHIDYIEIKSFAVCILFTITHNIDCWKKNDRRGTKMKLWI